METITLKRSSGDFGFEARDANKNIVCMDTKFELGGSNFGVRPMQMLLMGLGGCSGIDIVSILKKQRQDINDFEITIDGTREKKADTMLWSTIKIQFILSGNIDADKAQRACDLSMQKYCSVAKTLQLASCKISYDVVVKP